MRVTLDIPDEIHAWLKARAKQGGTTMRAIVLEAIDCVLRASKKTAKVQSEPTHERN
jgi:hypothetical protein